MITEELDLWPAIWERDFGFAPVGVHIVEPNMLWFYGDICIDPVAPAWSQMDMDKLAEVQIGAAIARVIKLDFTVQIRAKKVWLHREPKEECLFPVTKLFDSEGLLIRNLAKMSEWLLNNNYVHPLIVATNGATNLNILLGKFDIA